LSNHTWRAVPTNIAAAANTGDCRRALRKGELTARLRA